MTASLCGLWRGVKLTGTDRENDARQNVEGWSLRAQPPAFILCPRRITQLLTDERTRGDLNNCHDFVTSM
jgi:hypothetical protein